MPDRDYKHHNLPRLYGKVTIEDSLGVTESVQELQNYDEYVRYPKLEAGVIEMPADKYTEAKAEKTELQKSVGYVHFSNVSVLGSCLLLESLINVKISSEGHTATSPLSTMLQWREDLSKENFKRSS